MTGKVQTRTLGKLPWDGSHVTHVVLGVQELGDS